MPLNRDKRGQINDGFFDGKKLRKGGHGSELGPVQGGRGGRDRGSRDSWKMFPWPHKKYPPLGRGPAGQYGGMLPGPGFHDGEDEFNRKHRKLEEKWGLRSRRIEEGYIRGHGPMPSSGYPPRPPLPEFLHAPRRRNNQFQKLKRHRLGRDKEFSPMRDPHYDHLRFGPRFDNRQPHRHHDPHAPYHHGHYPPPHGRYSPDHDYYPPHHGGYPPYYGGNPDFGGSHVSGSTDSLLGPYTDDGSGSLYYDDPDGWDPGYYSGGEEDYPPHGGRYGYPRGPYDRPGGGRYGSPGPYAHSNSSTNSLRARFIDPHHRGRRY